MLKSAHVASWGTDPEGFFFRDGAVIGSEKVLDRRNGFYGVVKDGVQFEMHPYTHVTIRGLAGNLSRGFQAIKRSLPAGTTCCWDGLVEVSKEELKSLSPESRLLGCKPSHNVYGDKPITVNPKTYRKRSAAGHVHMGLTSPIFTQHTSEDERYRLVPLLDILVGNTCVLIDRDPGAAERRENYGRAGEYRLPKYGLEYRTLSNFWLRNYSLMSLAFGMCATAVSILEASLTEIDLEGELVECVNIENVVKAIDTNNWDLALANLETIRPFLTQHVPRHLGFPLHGSNIDKFIEFASAVNIKGIEGYFPSSYVDHWAGNKFVEFPTFLETL